MIVRLLLALLFFLVAAPYASAQNDDFSARLESPFEAPMAMLRPTVVVQSNLVTLGDLFDNAGALAETPVFRAPAPGTLGRVSIQDVAAAAQRAGLTRFDLAGLIDISVERRGRLLGGHELEELVARALDRQLVQRFGPEAGRYDLIFANQTAPAMVGEELVERLRIDILMAPTSRTQRFSAVVRLPDGSELARFEGRAEHLIQVPVLSRAISRGGVIRAGDIRMQEMAYNRTIGTPTLIATQDIVGQAANRSLRAGTPISPDDLTAPLMVERQELVTLIFRQGSLALTVSARALDDGAEGQAVDVMNLQSDRIVRGIVIADGQVQVLAPLQHIASSTTPSPSLSSTSNLERIQ